MKTAYNHTRFILLLLIIILCYQKLTAQDLKNEFSDYSFPIRSISAHRITEKIKIDGKLDEPLWKKVQFDKNFTQREPDIGEPASEETSIAVVYNDKKLFFGIQCFDKEPKKIIAREMRRDARLEDDDSFSLVFDTFNDKRNGFYFTINPNGCRRDATFSDEGQSYNSEWDGIWECETIINEEGWFAEIAIPLESLRFQKADSSTWGINVSRTIRRKNENVYWQLIPRDAGRMGLFRMSQAGKLNGLTGIKSGGNLEFEPYLLASSTNDETTDFDLKNKGDWGFDTKLSISSNTFVNFTWNTDFAQIEADQERVNLTRFSLYFPEKRDFFLDGAEMFNFGGQSLSGRGWEPDAGVRLFYSRRIGIVDGYQQPIIGGIKLFSKVGKNHIGLINVLTDKLSVYEEDDSDDSSELKRYKAINSTVFRLRREVLNRSSIGMMFLNNEHIDSTHYNRSLGFDANFPITDKVVISGSIAGTIGPNYMEEGITYNMKKQNLAGHMEAVYNSDLWEFKLSHQNIQDNFNADLGFIPRKDIKNTRGVIEYSPRAEKFPAIRQYGFRLSGSYLTDQNNRMLDNELSPVFYVSLENSSRLFIGFEKQEEYIDEDWELRPGYNIPQATYNDLSSFLWYSSDESRDIYGRCLMSYGGYYTGKLLYISPSITLTSIKRFDAQLNFRYNAMNMPEGTFHTNTIGCRLYYYFSTRFFLKAYLQYNDDKLANEGDSIALSNLLLRWTYRPGSDFYFVYNDTRLFGASDGLVSNRAAMLKFTYFWRN